MQARSGSSVGRALSAIAQCYSTHGYDESLYREFALYKRNINHNVFLYSFDLARYGTTQFPNDEPRVCLAGGFSDKVLNFIPMFERSRTDMLAEIEAVSVA